MDSVKNYIQENKDRFIAELIELLKMPSISADSDLCKLLPISNRLYEYAGRAIIG